MEKLSTIKRWFLQTSMLVGAPMLMILLVTGSQKVAFTFTCETVGYKCEYALGATDAMTQYMGQLVAANPNTEIVSRPIKR